jgi:hypothetical protein
MEEEAVEAVVEAVEEEKVEEQEQMIDYPLLITSSKSS